MQIPPNMQAMQNMQQNLHQMQQMQQSMQNQQGQRHLPQGPMPMGMTQPLENGSALMHVPPTGNSHDRRQLLNTCIYDYFRHSKMSSVCRAMVEANVPINKPENQLKQSPSQRANGVDDEFKDLPNIQMPPAIGGDSPFLLDWFTMFWDVFGAAQNPSEADPKIQEYTAHVRVSRVLPWGEVAATDRLKQMTLANQNNQRQMMNNNMNPAHYQTMMRNLQNGAGPNNLKRTAAINNSNPYVSFARSPGRR